MKNVLVVDDSSTMRKIIAMNLRKSDLHVDDIVLAENGRDALGKLDESTIDIVLTDINMPEMGGLEFIQNVRSTGRNAEVPIIVISTESGQELVEQALQAGASGYILKPFTPDSLGETLKPFLETS